MTRQDRRRVGWLLRWRQRRPLRWSQRRRLARSAGDDFCGRDEDSTDHRIFVYPDKFDDDCGVGFNCGLLEGQAALADVCKDIVPVKPNLTLDRDVEHPASYRAVPRLLEEKPDDIRPRCHGKLVPKGVTMSGGQKTLREHHVVVSELQFSALAGEQIGGAHLPPTRDVLVVGLPRVVILVDGDRHR